MSMTTKQVAAKVREALDVAAAHNGLRWADGREMILPSGLGFTVRATKTGVNIVIDDRGWVDEVTGGNREAITEWQREKEAIADQVDTIRDSYKPRLPGKTTWGPIFISARVTNVDHIGN
jgi:hypothetical protein